MLGPGWKRWARIATWVTFRFKVRGDERVLTTAVVSYGGDFEDDHPRARRNGTRIEYDPQEPEKARIVGESGDWLDRIIAGVVFTILIPVMAVIYRRHPDILGL